MHIPLDDEADAKIDYLVKNALGDKFEGQIKDKVDNLVSEVKDSIHWHVANDLEEELAGHIRDQAQRSAERFMERLVAGDEKAVHSFLQLPGDYLNERKNHHELLEDGEKYGGIALRKKLLEAVLPRLEAERIKDLEAGSSARLKELQKTRVECRSQSATIASLNDEIEDLNRKIERLEARPVLSVVGE